MERHKYVETGISAFSALALILLLSGAFSHKTREEIKKRSILRFGKLASEWTGDDEGPFEAAHIDHSKSNERYDDQSNGRLLKVSEHYDDHVNRAGRNGLNFWANLFALRKIWERMTDKDREGRNPPSFYANRNE